MAARTSAQVSFEFFVGEVWESEVWNEDEYVNLGFWMTGMGVKGGFSFRLWRNVALDLNGFFKFGFDSVYVDGMYEPVTPLVTGAALGLTFMFPY